MHKRFWAAAASAPLLMHACGALAGTTVSGATTAYVATSTAASGAASDVTIASGASVKPAGGSAITVDSSNNVENDGVVEINGYDGAVGVLVPGAVTAILTNVGTITLDDNYTAPDSVNGDGVAEAPFAQGTGRYGVRILAGMTGGLNNSGSIAVSGDQSYGVSIEGPLLGDVLSTGAISLTGDGGAAFRTTAAISGSVQFAAAVSATGQGSSAIDLGGGVGGRLSLYSTVTATGYAATTRTTNSASLAKIQATPADLQQGGAALKIQGDVAGGVFLAAPPGGTASGSTADLDGDGVADGAEGTAVVTSYGSAPAIAIGGPAPLSLGAFGTGLNAFGLIIRGSAVGAGVYDGASAEALDIGGAGVSIAGGVRVVGTVSATAYQADATAIRLGPGAIIPTLQNEGTIKSVVSSSVGATARTLTLDPGAQLSQLVNYGTLSAAMTGASGSATAVTDGSGSIGLVENTGVISATIAPVQAGDPVSGSTTALDLRANTAGVLLRQELNGAVSPIIAGDVLLGSGVNTVQLLSGSLTGALAMGSAPGSSLLIAGGAAYSGAFTYAGSSLALDIASGSFTDTSATALGLSSLNVAAGGTLTLAVDPDRGAATILKVSGTATIAPGAALGVTLLSAPIGPQSYTLIQAANLLTPAGQTSLVVAAPYLFKASAAADPQAGLVTVDLRLKSAAELGLNRSEAAAFGPLYAALSKDSGVSGAILGAQTQAAFLQTYDQLLPDHAGDVFRVASLASSQVGQAIGEIRLDPADAGGATAWLQEITFGLKQSKGDAEAYSAVTNGLAGGFGIGGGAQQLGVSAAGVVSTIDPSDRPSGDQVSVSTLELGFYWRGDFSGFQADARLAGGYLFVRDKRGFAATVGSAAIARSASSQWSGYDLAARAGLAYPIRLGRALIQPQVNVEFFKLHEGGYSETGGGDGMDLIVQDRDTTQAVTTAGIVAGWNFGSDFVWRPELELGWKGAMAASGGDTTARFAYGGDSFTLVSNDLTGSGGVARLRLTGQGRDYRVSFEAAGDFQSDATSGGVRAAVQFPF